MRSTVICTQIGCSHTVRDGHINSPILSYCKLVWDSNLLLGDWWCIPLWLTSRSYITSYTCFHREFPYIANKSGYASLVPAIHRPIFQDLVVLAASLIA